MVSLKTQRILHSKVIYCVGRKKTYIIYIANLIHTNARVARVLY